MCEATARARLWKCWRVLHRTKDVYGVPGYYVCDYRNTIEYGMPPNALVTLEDVAEYIKELDEEQQATGQTE